MREIKLFDNNNIVFGIKHKEVTVICVETG